VTCLLEAADQAAANQADRPPGWTERQAGEYADGRTARGVTTDEVSLIVDVDVVAGDSSAHDDPALAMHLDERGLLEPRRSRRPVFR
jgi:hypothetical protein